MKRLAGNIKTHVVRPVFRTGKFVVRLNMHILANGVDGAWSIIPMHQKLTWIVFVANTVAVLTILEFLLLHK